MTTTTATRSVDRVRHAVGTVVRVLVTALYLDVLWLAACVPVVSAPASTAAVSAVVRAWVVEGETPTASAFWRELRTQLRPCVLLGALQVAAAGLLAADLYAIGWMGADRRFWLVAWAAVALVLALLQVFTLAALSERRAGVRDALLTAARTSVAHPLHAALAVLGVVAAVLAVAASPALLLVAGVATAAAVDLVWRRARRRSTR